MRVRTREAVIKLCHLWRLLLLPVSICLLLLPAQPALAQKLPRDVVTAVRLAKVMIAMRSVISELQNKINDPALGDKKIDSLSLSKLVKKRFNKQTGLNLDQLAKDRRVGTLYQAQLAAIGLAMSDREAEIDQAGIGFKGFVPSLFSRAVARHFNGMAGGAVRIKMTASKDLVRNRHALPDDWEANAIKIRLSAKNWEKDKPFYTATEGSDGKRLRVLVPEYFEKSCLACHGGPKGTLDQSGHPKEGKNEGALAGVMSISTVR